MKFLHLTWSNLKRRKLRTILTLLSILVAFLLFGFLCAIKEAFGAGVSLANADRLMVRHKTSIIQSLPLSYQARIANIPGVSAVTHMSWFGGIYKDPKDFMPSFPVEPDKYLNMYPEFLLPAEQLQAWKENRIGAVVGRTTFDRFAARDGWKIGSRVPFTSPIWGSLRRRITGSSRSSASMRARRRARTPRSSCSAMTTSMKRGRRTKARWAGLACACRTRIKRRRSPS